jgi:class 3 adenylate cyclase
MVGASMVGGAVRGGCDRFPMVPVVGKPLTDVTAATWLLTIASLVVAGWVALGQGLPSFGLGIGLSTGQIAAALLGSHDRVEYTVVGDTVNLAAPLCDAARPAGSTVASAATVSGSKTTDGYEMLPALQVKGRVSTVAAYRNPPLSLDGWGPGTDNRVAAERLSEIHGRMNREDC